MAIDGAGSSTLSSSSSGEPDKLDLQMTGGW